MKLKYRRTLAAAILTGIAFSAAADGIVGVYVAQGEACPAGTIERAPSYQWQDGHFVRDGAFCGNPGRGGL
jgi:hypothetical protein